MKIDNIMNFEITRVDAHCKPQVFEIAQIININNQVDNLGILQK